MGAGARSPQTAGARWLRGTGRRARCPVGARRAVAGNGLSRAIHSILVSLPIVLAWPAPATAQEFGQWSWEALASFGGRSRDNFVDDESGGRYRENTLGLSLGMNGFIVHPAISRFRLGADLQFIRTDSGQSLDTNRTGLQGNFEFLPRGPHRGSLYINRQLYDYGGSAVDDPFTLLSIPDTLTTWGGRFRAARGFLAGSLLGFDRSAISFIEPGVNQQVYDRQFYDWSRDTSDFSHHVRLEHRYRDLGTVDLNYDELRLNIDERGDFSPAWHWTLTGSGVRQDSESFGMAPQRIDDYQLRSRLTHDIRERDLVEFFYEFGLTEPDTQPSTESHGLSVAYKWRPHPMWNIGPVASYATISSDLQDVRAPRAGLVVGWDWAPQPWNLGFVARGSYGFLERDAGGMIQKEHQSAGSFVGTVGHGTMEGLRKELEVELVRDRLRVTQTQLVTPPGLGLPLPGLGTEDLERGRITLGHRWDSQFINAWGDWTRRRSDVLFTGEAIATETLTATLQYGAHRFDIKANIADTDVTEDALTRQNIRSLGLGASWRPWRGVSVHGSYRVDQRHIALAPDVDGTQLEAGVRWQVGLFYLDFTLLESTQAFSGNPETRVRGITGNLTRRFGGWLPIVSGPERRGVIR